MRKVVAYYEEMRERAWYGVLHDRYGVEEGITGEEICLAGGATNSERMR